MYQFNRMKQERHSCSCCHMTGVAGIVALGVSHAFRKAFFARLAGLSLDQILIDYDIETAANLNADKRVARMLRRAIIAASRAVDAGTHYEQAHEHLMHVLAKSAQAVTAKLKAQQHAVEKNSAA